MVNTSSLLPNLTDTIRMLSEWLLADALLINPSQSKAMFFGHNDHYPLLVDILISDYRIDIVSKDIYLLQSVKYELVHALLMSRILRSSFGDYDLGIPVLNRIVNSILR